MNGVAPASLAAAQCQTFARFASARPQWEGACTPRVRSDQFDPALGRRQELATRRRCRRRIHAWKQQPLRRQHVTPTLPFPGREPAHRWLANAEADDGGAILRRREERRTDSAQELRSRRSRR
jgi:hypothetical protein